MKKFSYIILPFICCGIIEAGSCCCSCKSGCCPTPPKTKVEKKITQEKTRTHKDIIQQEYTKVAEGSSSCIPGAGCCDTVGGCCGGGSDLSKYLGYSKKELGELSDANLGLGCGHPVSLGEIKDGDTVLDLGSGAGIDCFIAAKKTGPSGKVIGVDMTEAMLKKARENAQKYGFENVEFRRGYIENLPVADNSVDIIISNCVINLSDDKQKVFQEAFRVLKPGGKMYVSDVVLLNDLSEDQKKDPKLICACEEPGGSRPESTASTCLWDDTDSLSPPVR